MHCRIVNRISVWYPLDASSVFPSSHHIQKCLQMLPNAPRVVESVQDRPQLRTTDLKYKEKLQKQSLLRWTLKGRWDCFQVGREMQGIWGRAGAYWGSWEKWKLSYWWGEKWCKCWNLAVVGDWATAVDGNPWRSGAAVWAQFEQGNEFESKCAMAWVGRALR